jgi:Domain of unknown function (DUF4389)
MSAADDERMTTTEFDVAHEHAPVRLHLRDDLRRSRLTIFFRLPLVIPHAIWLFLWSIAAFFAAIANWFATLALGRPPAALHRFLSAYVRYATHVNAYLYLVANPWPGFTGVAGSYPIDVEIPPPARQARWKTLLRVILALPALLLSLFFGGPLLAPRPFYSRGSGRYAGGVTVGSGFLVGVCALLGWFASLGRGRMPRGLRDAGAYGIGYGAQVLAYVLLLSDRYPNSDPEELLRELEPPPEHPVRLVVTDDLRRSRVTVLFRLLLAVPHLVWYTLWTIVALIVSIPNWFATLFAGRPPRPFHRFLSAYVRYATHAFAFLYLVGNPFPGFVGAHGSYPVDIAVSHPSRQSRWRTGFRFILAIPAFLVNTALSYALLVVAVLLWFVSLVRGRAAPGLCNLGAYALRYQAQLNAYLYLVADRYPHASPLEGRAAPAESPPDEPSLQTTPSPPSTA